MTHDMKMGVTRLYGNVKPLTFPPYRKRLGDGNGGNVGIRQATCCLVCSSWLDPRLLRSQIHHSGGRIQICCKPYQGSIQIPPYYL
uniref:Uncharacterized protein n=1 Tax=Kalanchoe fedtschenkoi TaxID=63787 RepID=A0A7N0SWG6_KALFE